MATGIGYLDTPEKLGMEKRLAVEQPADDKVS